MNAVVGYLCLLVWLYDLCCAISDTNHFLTSIQLIASPDSDASENNESDHVIGGVYCVF
jgi:hypothetical protein